MCLSKDYIKKKGLLSRAVLFFVAMSLRGSAGAIDSRSLGTHARPSDEATELTNLLKSKHYD